VNLLEEPRVIREALAVHEAFRRLGFPSEQIFVLPGAGAADLFAVVLKYDGDKQYVVTSGEQGMSFDEMMSRWPRAVEAWNSGPETVRQAIWEGSEILGRAFDLAASLMDRGIEIPHQRREAS